MNAREFFNRVANGKSDFLQIFLSLLEKEAAGYCAIGGLAVNAYAEPVVSLDLDVVIAADRVNGLLSILKGRYSVVEYPNSLNVSDTSSDLRVQIQTDPRYQPFLRRASMRKVLDMIFMSPPLKMCAGQDLGRHGRREAREQAAEGPGGYHAPCGNKAGTAPTAARSHKKGAAFVKWKRRWL